jgi:anti-anti-sigma factor
MMPEDVYPVQWTGRQALIVLPEHIDVSNAGSIREELLSVINRGAAALIVDMTATISCDQAGAKAVARAYQRAVVSGTELRLAVTSDAVLEMLGVTGVGHVVPVYPSVEAAEVARSPAASATRPAAAAHQARPRSRPRAVGAGRGLTLAQRPDPPVVTPDLLRNMIEAFGDGVALTDREGTLVLASARLEEMFGYRRAELAGQPVERLIPAHLQAVRARPLGAGALLTGLRKDGTPFPVQVSLSPVPAAGGHFSLAVVRDMAEVRSLADVDAARPGGDLLDSVVTRLYQAGVSLQAAAGLLSDAARPHLEEALRTLDETISQIRDSTFTGHAGNGDQPGPGPRRVPGGSARR